MYFITLISFIIAILSFSYFFLLNVKRYILHEKVEDYNLKSIISCSLTILFWLTTYSLNAIYERIQNPHINNTGVEEYSGTLGDLVGGILNPITALFGILVGGLAFYAQYQANKQIQEQFKSQQFESQFYEMLHLHRENLNEMSIEGYEFESKVKGKKKKISKIKKTTSGKKVFVTMLKEFEAIYLIGTRVFSQKFDLLVSPNKNHVNKLLMQFIFDHSYFVFFNGITLYKKKIDKYKKEDITGFLNLVLDDFIIELENIKKLHLETGKKQYSNYHITKSLINYNFKTKTLWLSFNYKPFSGHQSILAHYYRHLFQIVKFVAKQNENNISYESKRDYLRILRSMLSNHEQILLLYNWFGGFGSEWEEKKLKKRKNKIGNYYFTDYRMIHNIPQDLLISDIDLNNVFNVNFRNFRHEKNRKEKDTLFELTKIVSTKIID